jgi:phosphopantetheinyl transferase (holo-ACP synthase)
LHGGAAVRAESMQVRRSLVTITHAETVAIAQVMLLGD